MNQIVFRRLLILRGFYLELPIARLAVAPRDRNAYVQATLHKPLKPELALPDVDKTLIHNFTNQLSDARNGLAS